MKIVKKYKYYFAAALVVSGFALIALMSYRKMGNKTASAAKQTFMERRLPIYSVSTDKPKVALSFDAAWGNEDTKILLDILDKYNVKVTFFMTGEWVKAFPEDVKEIQKRGHDLGNHSQNHLQMSRLSRDKCIKEIMDVHSRVKELTGVEMCLFRPPYGDYNNTLINAVEECGYYPIQWSVDSLVTRV